ncbi:hypothetical protein GOODEAATRI_000886, partial [Goodea atripinnis]
VYRAACKEAGYYKYSKTSGYKFYLFQQAVCLKHLCTYRLLHFRQSNFFVPPMLFGVLKRLAETGDGLLKLALLSVDPLHVRWSKLLVLQEVLKLVPLML